ncbi:DMT family transporter [Clostridium sp. HMP27]|uniref:DMT family transporter n=1 Tax=Clostridium sp. HMP27 TaxID=1487921 RepID=UPI00068A7CC5|nr:DMT family transporter [Clostridium sp. HMP27]
MNSKKEFLPYIASICYATIFGLSFLFSKKALNHSSPFELLSYRFLVGFIFMSLLILFKAVTVNYKNKNLKPLFLVALAQPVFYFIFETYGLKFSSSSQAGIMIALIPICVTIAAIYFLNEKSNIYQWIFIVLSVIGVVLITIYNGNSNSSNSVLGTFLLLGAVISASVFNILSRKVSIRFSSFEITYFMMGIAALTFNFLSLSTHLVNGTLINYFAPLKSKDFLISIFYLGLLSSVVAFFLVNYSLSKLEASKSVVFTNLSTIVSIVAGVVFLKEKFYTYHIIGSLLILGGIWGTNHMNISKQKEKNTLFKGEESYATDKN